MLRQVVDPQSQTIRELRQSIEDQRKIVEEKRKTIEEQRKTIEELRQVIEEQRKTTKEQEGAPPCIKVAEEQGGLANSGDIWDTIMSAVRANGKMTAENKGVLEQVGPWLLLFLFLVIHFHQMEAIPRRDHGWKVADSRKCLLIEAVDEEKAGGEQKCGWRWPCNFINPRSFMVGVWFCGNSVKYSIT